MWYTKITGIYWKNKERHIFCIDEESEKAEKSFRKKLESIYNEKAVFEISKHEKYWKEE